MRKCNCLIAELSYIDYNTKLFNNKMNLSNYKIY